MKINKLFFGLVFVLLTACATTMPQTRQMGTSASSGNIAITNAWTRQNAGPNSAAYMVIENKAATADMLVAGSAKNVGKVTFHETQTKDGVSLMLPIKDGMTIPAKGKLELKPGSFHIMLEEIKENFKVGETLPIVLKFQSGAELSLNLPIFEPGADPTHGGH
jgi:hypothetical protein